METKKVTELNNQQKVVLGALFHDIGKFRQRRGDKYLSDYNVDLCPQFEGKISHVHAGHTGKFLEEMGLDDIADISAKHHLSADKLDNNEIDNILTAIIKKADWLSSGMDREKLKDYDQNTKDRSDRLSKEQQHYIKARLESVFEQVFDNKTDEEKLITQLKPLSNKDVFPSKRDEINDSYEALYSQFLEEANDFGFDKQSNFNQQYLSWLYLLEKYTWCIPSSSYDVIPNVSLYDHSKTTAAFSDALYLYHEDQNTLNYKNIINGNLAENKFVLIQGDFSGIQDFIFNIKGHSHAAKMLRARSFFVSIATDITAYALCEEIGLTSAGIVMNAGGKFTILAPNTSKTHKAIENIENLVNKRFRDLTYGQTRMNIACVEASEQDFYIHLDSVPMFSEKMKELNNKLEQKKLKVEIENPVFKNYLTEWTNKNQDEGACDSCNTNPKQDGDFCVDCKKFDEIGKQIIKADFISIGKNLKSDKSDFFEMILGYKISFKKDINAEYIFALKEESNNLTKKEFYPIKRYAGNLPKITKDDIENLKYENISERIQEKDFSFQEELPKTFEYIAHDSLTDNGEMKYKGKPFLGIIKADVDDLGFIFSKGFEREIKDKKINTATFSKYASLSRMLDYFFTTVLVEHIKENKMNIYTVFAGGDDLFLIGSWTEMFGLAKWINDEFKKYIANNSNIHLSMGFALAKASLPVPKMGELAEEQLSLSKNCKDKDVEKIVKNAFSMFDQTIGWTDFNKLMSFEEKIKNIEKNYSNELHEEGLSTQYLYRILHFCEMSEGTKHRDLMWEPLFHYVTAKNYTDKNMQKELLDISKDIKNWGNKLKIPLSKILYEERE